MLNVETRLHQILNVEELGASQTVKMKGELSDIKSGEGASSDIKYQEGLSDGKN